MDFHVEDHETCVIYTPKQKEKFEILHAIFQKTKRPVSFQMNGEIYLYLSNMTISLRTGQEVYIPEDKEIYLVTRSYN